MRDAAARLLHKIAQAAERRAAQDPPGVQHSLLSPGPSMQPQAAGGAGSGQQAPQQGKVQVQVQVQAAGQGAARAEAWRVEAHSMWYDLNLPMSASCDDVPQNSALSLIMRASQVGSSGCMDA